jgi:hypothetical protein
MKLHIHKSQSESTGMLGGKKCVYFLRVTSELSEEEIRLLNKYGFFSESFIFDTEIVANTSVRKEMKGPETMSISLLQKGVEWSCSGYLPSFFANIPDILLAGLEARLTMAIARETWGGEETIEGFK